MFGGFFKNMVKSADEVLIAGVKVGLRRAPIPARQMRLQPLPQWPAACFCFPKKEVDDFFEQEKTFLLDYFSKIKEATAKAEKMTRSHKSIVKVSPYNLNKNTHSVNTNDVVFLQILQMITFVFLPL